MQRFIAGLSRLDNQRSHIENSKTISKKIHVVLAEVNWREGKTNIADKNDVRHIAQFSILLIF